MARFSFYDPGVVGERWYSFLFLQIISNTYIVIFSEMYIEEIFFLLQFELVVMVNLKINSNLPLCIIVKGNGR